MRLVMGTPIFAFMVPWRAEDMQVPGSAAFNPEVMGVVCANIFTRMNVCHIYIYIHTFIFDIVFGGGCCAFRFCGGVGKGNTGADSKEPILCLRGLHFLEHALMPIHHPVYLGAKVGITGNYFGGLGRLNCLGELRSQRYLETPM